jgi:hypothetical protein
VKKKLETRQLSPYLFSMIKNNVLETSLNFYRDSYLSEQKAALALAREVGAYKGIVEAISRGWVPGVTVTDTEALKKLLANVENLVNR